MNAPRPSAAFDFDGGLVLLHPDRTRLFAYGELAALAWRALEAGASDDEAAGAAADAATAGAIAALIRGWREHGLVGAGARDAREEPTGALPPPRPFEAELRIALRGRTVSIALERERRGALLGVLLAPLATAAPADSRIEVREAPCGAAAVLVDGSETVRTADEGLILGAVYQALLGMAWPGVDWLCLIHGAALSLDGAGIGLPAASGSGKSTLAAALSARGFDYLADDLLALAAPEGEIVPWPMPISIKQGSWAALAPLLPGFERAPVYRTKGTRARLVAPRPAAWEHQPVPLRLLASPIYEAGAEPLLRPLRPLDMLARLLGDRIWIGHPLQPDRVRRFLDRLARTPCFELRYGSLDDATALLRDHPADRATWPRAVGAAC